MHRFEFSDFCVWSAGWACTPPLSLCIHAHCYCAIYSEGGLPRAKHEDDMRFGLAGVIDDTFERGFTYILVFSAKFGT